VLVSRDAGGDAPARAVRGRRYRKGREATLWLRGERCSRIRWPRMDRVLNGRRPRTPPRLPAAGIASVAGRGKNWQSRSARKDRGAWRWLASPATENACSLTACAAGSSLRHWRAWASRQSPILNGLALLSWRTCLRSWTWRQGNCCPVLVTLL